MSKDYFFYLDLIKTSEKLTQKFTFCIPLPLKKTQKFEHYFLFLDLSKSGNNPLTTNFNKNWDVVVVNKLEGFKALKFSRLEYFRALKCNGQI